MPPIPSTLVLLCLTAFFAGFVDAVAGGGGLIQLPGLFLLLPAHTPVLAVLGTNKVAALAGTSVAAWRYHRQVRPDPAVLLPAGLCAFACSGMGAWTVRLVDPARFKPAVLVVLVVMAIYTYGQREFGIPNAARKDLTRSQRAWRGAWTGTAIGFYDGFFGPGTGSLLIFAFVTALGQEFLVASATAKAVNVVTNVGALMAFISSGQVWWAVALPMAVSNVLGAECGSRLAILKGSRFVRTVFLMVMAAVIARFSYDLFGPRRAG